MHLILKCKQIKQKQQQALVLVVFIDFVKAWELLTLKIELFKKTFIHDQVIFFIKVKGQNCDNYNRNLTRSKGFCFLFDIVTSNMIKLIKGYDKWIK